VRGFDPDGFVAACRAALRDAAAAAAVADVVESTVRRHASTIDAVLGPAPVGDPEVLHASPELTVQRIAWPGGSASPPHDHRMWAVVGVYAGREVNRVFDRDGSAIRPGRTVDVDAGDVFTLPADAVHEVRNPDRRWTVGLHVYGGDIAGTDRSAWLPDGTEVAQAEAASQRRVMVQAMRDLATDLGRPVSDEERYLGLAALWAAAERRRRHLTAEESRLVVAGAWGVPPDRDGPGPFDGSELA
jgi:predicted metal-dependent enzyme (double-stranded beta helix superfamily)